MPLDCALKRGVACIAQVHVDAAGRTRVFSRAGEDSTQRYFAVARQVAACRVNPGGGSVVVEGEVVAVDTHTGAILPFQTMTARIRYVRHIVGCLVIPARVHVSQTPYFGLRASQHTSVGLSTTSLLQYTP